MFTVRDIGVSFSGDLTLSAGGDLKLSDSFESAKAAINFIARTDKGGYKPDSRVGGDLGSLIGDKMSKDNLLSMEGSLSQNLTKFVMNEEDFQVHVVPLTQEDVGVFVAVAGEFIDNDGNVIDIEPEVITYTFPYAEGSATPEPQ